MTFPDLDLGVFTSTGVLDDGLPILLVIHDGAGDWQFLSGLEEHGSEARYVHLSHLLAFDESLIGIGDLPLGFKAWRASRADQWERGTFAQSQLSI